LAWKNRTSISHIMEWSWFQFQPLKLLISFRGSKYFSNFINFISHAKSIYLKNIGRDCGNTSPNKDRVDICLLVKEDIILLMSTLRKVWDCRVGLPLPVGDIKTVKQLIFVGDAIDNQSFCVLPSYPISIWNNFTHQEYPYWLVCAHHHTINTASWLTFNNWIPSAQNASSERWWNVV